MKRTLPWILFAILMLPTLDSHAVTNWTTLLQDNFESGDTGLWNMEPAWALTPDGTNTVLQNTNTHAWARTTTGTLWADYSASVRIRLNIGQVHMSCKVGDNGRYALRVERWGVHLSRESPWGSWTNLAEDSIENPMGVWHTVEVITDSSNIQVLVNGLLRLNCNDPEPLTHGYLAFESLTDVGLCEVALDDILVSREPDPEPPAPFSYVWTRTGGPLGGLGYDVRIHPIDHRIMYVTDNPSGINKSRDGGATWKQKNTGIVTRAGPSMDGIPVFSLTMDPQDPNTVWAGTQNATGIYRSSDGGETWVKKDNGIQEVMPLSFRGFGVHPTNSNVVLAGAELAGGRNGVEFDMAKGRIYKTTDGGDNWSTAWAGGSLVRFIIFDPSAPDTVYASTGIFDREADNTNGVGILKSTDCGASWFPINNGISNLFTGFLEMHPTNPQCLFAASGNNAWGYPPNSLMGNVNRTTNGGESWETVLGDDLFTVVTVSQANPDFIYAGSATAFYLSTNRGDQGTWQKLWKESEGCWGPSGIRAGVPISAVVDPTDPMSIFVNNYGGGNFKSTDGGKTWVDSSRGYTGATMHHVAVASDDAATVFAIGRSGPFKSANSGTDWEGLLYAPASFAEWDTVALKPGSPQEVLMADEHQGVILRSTNGGSAWTLVFRHPLVNAADPVNRHGFKAIAYAPSSSSVVYAGMRKERRSIDGDMPKGPSYGVYKSLDSGQTWFAITNGLGTPYFNVHCIVVNPTNDSNVYLGTWQDGVFRTSDGGSNWIAVNNGLTSMDVRSLAINPSSPDTLYAGLGEGMGVFKTTNGGNLWIAMNEGIPLQCPSSLLPAGKVMQGVSVLQSLPTHLIGSDYYAVPWTSVWGLSVDPLHPEIVYAADHQAGVYASTNGGNGWTQVNDGLGTRAVTALAISSDGSVVYASTEGGGVFRYSMDSDGDGLGNYDEILWHSDPMVTDTDGDGAGDYDEIRAGTDPTNRLSAFRLNAIRPTNENGVVVQWTSASNKYYTVEKSTNLLQGFQPFLFGISGGSSNTVCTDAFGNSGSSFYRIKLDSD